MSAGKCLPLAASADPGASSWSLLGLSFQPCEPGLKGTRAFSSHRPTPQSVTLQSVPPVCNWEVLASTVWKPAAHRRCSTVVSFPQTHLDAYEQGGGGAATGREESLHLVKTAVPFCSRQGCAFTGSPASPPWPAPRAQCQSPGSACTMCVPRSLTLVPSAASAQRRLFVVASSCQPRTRDPPVPRCTALQHR